MNIEEYVPTIIPIIIAKRNPLIVAPPKKNMTISTRIEVIPVFIVRLRVSFMCQVYYFLNRTFPVKRKKLPQSVEHDNCVVY